MHTISYNKDYRYIQQTIITNYRHVITLQEYQLSNIYRQYNIIMIINKYNKHYLFNNKHIIAIYYHYITMIINTQQTIIVQ